MQTDSIIFFEAYSIYPEYIKNACEIAAKYQVLGRYIEVFISLIRNTSFNLLKDINTKKDMIRQCSNKSLCMCGIEEKSGDFIPFCHESY